MSNSGAEGKNLVKTGTELWMMNADGSAKTRLTFFNQPGHKHYQGGKTIAADFAWGPKNKSIISYCITNKTEEKIFLITLN